VLAAAALAASLAGCDLESMMAFPGQQAKVAPPPIVTDPMLDAPTGGLNAAIGRYSAQYHVPESLIRRIIVRESAYNAKAHRGPYWGLMQIRYDTARSLGYDGPPSGLLDAETNLRYGCKYLAGAYKVAYGDPEKAVSYYASGYYYDARRLGMLQEVGLKRGK